MIGRDGTYFTPEQCLNGHFIITGMTNDIFCGERMIPVTLREELSEHLRRRGFDAVIFLDSQNMVYCYDSQSWQVLREGRISPVQQEPRRSEAAERVAAQGPMGRRTRRRTAQPAPAAEPAARPAGNVPDVLNMGRMYTSQAWDRVSGLMTNPDIRCAFVFPNADSMQRTFPESMLQVLEELSAGRIGNHSIAVYVYTEDMLCNLENNARWGSDAWRTFVESILLPRINSRNEESNCVMTIGAPNAAEIRNLLTWLRLRENDPVQVLDIGEMAQEMAVLCAREGWRLQRLMIHLDDFIKRNPGQPISIENWEDILKQPRQQPALRELDRMIGLENIKQQIHARFDEMRIGGRTANNIPRYASRFAPPPQARGGNGHDLNVIIKGPPGTGKTTLARLFGRLYYECGYLPTGHLVTATKGNIEGTHVGEAAANIHTLVEEALGGVLFIDEAYSLVNTGSPYGREAIDQLVAEMSEHEGQFAVILAGYVRPMDELMQSNDGLHRRFPNEYVLDDYNPGEMQQLLLRFAENDHDNVRIDPSLIEKTEREDGQKRSVMDDFCEAWRDSKEGVWQNAGEAQTLLIEMKRMFGMRAGNSLEPRNGFVLTAEDVPERLRYCLQPRSRKLEEAWKQIDEMIGLSNVKKFLRQLALGIFWEADEKSPGRFIFSGPPGTGKTHVARLMGDILYLLGVLRRRHVTERKAADFLQADNPVAALNEAVEQARRGMLFIDEAHQLADTDIGRELLRALVPIIEDPEIRADTGFILAGYNHEMKRMLEVDSGLARRFPENHRIRFTDYTANELRRILEMFAENAGEIPSQGYLDRSEAILETYLANRPENFGNAGFIRDNYLPDSVVARTHRLNRQYADGRVIAERSVVNAVSETEKRTLTPDDIPVRFAGYAAPDATPVGDQDAIDSVRKELVGKQEIIDFITTFRREQGEVRFADENGTGSMNYTVAGPGGSGRHTSVRNIAKALCQLNLLETGHVHFVSRGDLEAEYVGQTAPKTQNVVEEAVGGTLAVLSPSSMLQGNERSNSFGPEALATIIGNMSAHMHDTSFVFIDSPEGMKAFLRAFPSVRSLLAREFVLDDILPEDMERIFRIKTEQSYAFTEEAGNLLSDFFLNWVSQRGGLGDQARSWGNGKELERLIDGLRANWEKHGGETERSGRMPRRLITPDMFPENLKKYLRRTRVEAKNALDELNRMTGLRRVKAALRAIERRIRSHGEGQTAPGLYCYLGNPGAGKTTVARLMGGVLRAAKVLSQGHVIERRAQDFISNPYLLDEAIKLAKNGILFIDEAHQLAAYDTGRTTIDRLLHVLEDTEITRHTCIILAGYPAEMRRLLATDPGLNSRFGRDDSLIWFEDYTADELTQIMTAMAAKADRMPEIGAVAPLELTAEYTEQAAQIFESICAGGDTNFGNARGVRNFLHDSLDRMLERMDTGAGEIRQDALRESDIPRKYQNLLNAQRLSSEIEPRGIPTHVVGELTPERISQLEVGVVLLEAYRDGRMISSGTGSIISEDGVILTCQHVARASGDIVAYIHIPGIPGGRPLKYKCERMYPMFEDCDMALLKMEGTGFPALSVRPPHEDVGKEEGTLIMGYSLGSGINGGNAETLKPTRYSGSVASIQQMEGGIVRCYVDSRGTRGNSGSPVFSKKDGRIIGVFTGSYKPTDEEINFFNPIRYFWERFVIGSEPEQEG